MLVHQMGMLLHNKEIPRHAIHTDFSPQYPIFSTRITTSVSLALMGAFELLSWEMVKIERDTNRFWGAVQLFGPR